MFVVKNGLMPLGSLLLLNWFVIELVVMSYCLYDVFYNPLPLVPKQTISAIAYVKNVSNDAIPQQIQAIKAPDDAYYIDTVYSIISCFDAPYMRDTITVKTKPDCQKIYESDSVDIKADLKPIINIIINTFDKYLPVNENVYIGNYKLTFSVGTDGKISEVCIVPYISDFNILVDQLQLALSGTIILPPAYKNGYAVPCRYEIPMYLCED